MTKKDEKVIRVTGYGDKSGKQKSGAKIDIYSGDPKDPHDSIHIKVDTDKKSFETVTKIDGKKEPGSGSCYLTTACMQYYSEDFDDDCYELFILRWFRDNFVTQREIEHYYEIAPAIVASINEMPDCEQIYNYIYETIISPCVNAIKHGDFKFAYNRYKNSILALEEEYVVSNLENNKRKVLAL